jgi:hypothetical protein
LAVKSHILSKEKAMPKLKNNSLKLDTPAAAVRRNAKGLILLLIGVILGALIVVGQQGEQVTKRNIPVTDRFENAIKAKEPKFKLVSKHMVKTHPEDSVLQGWKSDGDMVSVSTYELASPEEAAEKLRKTLEAPVSVPVQNIKLTQLGDEAYLSTNTYAKEGQTDLLFRKGKFLIVMSASSQGLAKRFAKHMAAEIEN